MKKILIIALSLLVMFVLSGCIQMSMRVKVNKDGSGSVVQMLMMQKQMMTEVGDGGPVCDEKEFMENASKMGADVKYKSAKEVSNEKFLGCEVTYTFKDITKINLDQNPSGNMPQDESAEEQKHEYLKFSLKREKGVSTLGIALPEEDKDEEPAKKPSSPKDMQQEAMMKMMMRQLAADMYVGVIIEVDGKVIESNATHRDGSTVTLVELDFNKLLETPGAFDRLMDSDSKGIEETKRVMKNTPGIRGEDKRNISISFK